MGEAGGDEDEDGDEEVHAQGVGGFGFECAGDAAVKEGDSEEDADAEADPGVDGGAAVEEAGHEDGANGVGQGGEATLVGVPAVKTLADPAQEQCAPEDEEEVEEEGDDGITQDDWEGESLDGVEWADLVTEDEEAGAFEGDTGYQPGEEEAEEDSLRAFLLLVDPFPGLGWIEEQLERCDHAGQKC